MNEGLHPRLVVTCGGQVLAEHVLAPGAEVVIGRSEGCEVTITDSSVSRMHARIQADGRAVYVEDLGSANGTFVDGERITGRLRLVDGQLVRAAQKMLTAPTVVRLDAPFAAALVTSADPAGTAPSGGPGDHLRSAPPPTATRPVAIARPAASEPREAIDPPTRPHSGPEPGPPSPRRRPSMLLVVVLIALAGVAGAAGVTLWLLGIPGPLARLGLAPRPAATPAPEPGPPALAPTTLAMSSPLPPPQPEGSAEPLPAEPVATAAADAAPPGGGEIVPVAATSPAPVALAQATAPPAAVPSPATAASPAATPATAASPAAATVDGRWTVNLQNLFYAEDDYVIELRLDLRQRRNRVEGEGQAWIEGKAMTFRVPRADATGSVRGDPPTLKLEIPFGRPLGTLQLEGKVQGDTMTGTFRSSLLKQPGGWQGTRRPR